MNRFSSILFTIVLSLTAYDSSCAIEIPGCSGQLLVISKGGSYRSEALDFVIEIADTELSTQVIDGDGSSSNAEPVNTEIAITLFGMSDRSLIFKGKIKQRKSKVSSYTKFTG